jgi:hypothetical protein
LCQETIGTVTLTATLRGGLFYLQNPLEVSAMPVNILNLPGLAVVDFRQFQAPASGYVSGYAIKPLTRPTTLQRYNALLENPFALIAVVLPLLCVGFMLSLYFLCAIAQHEYGQRLIIPTRIFPARWLE